MLRLYSKNCEYALRILSEISLRKANDKFLAEDIARKAKIAMPSARKVLQLLSEAKYLTAVPGPNGGYQLTRNPRAINLLEIIQTIDGKNCFDHCIMGLPQCSTKNPCPVHHLWAGIKVGMKGTMRRTKLTELMHE